MTKLLLKTAFIDIKFPRNRGYFDREIDDRYMLHLGEDNQPKIYDTILKKYLHTWLANKGYPNTKLHGKNIHIHKIVARCFHGPRPEGLVINHLDGNKENNHPSNLEYCTQGENIKHSVIMGLHVANHPERHGNYKDGRCMNIKAYKAQWHQNNKKRLKNEG